MKSKINKEIIQFVSAKPYLNLPDEEFYKVFFCLHGRREVVVLCSDGLKETLRNLSSDYLQPKLTDIKAYLVNILEDGGNWFSLKDGLRGLRAESTSPILY